jgi:flagellar basal-body rod protein FlgF
MDIGIYQSASALSSLEKWQDAVAQNITSGQVTGFRKRTVEFSGQTAGGWGIDGVSQADGGDPSQSAIFPTTTNGISFASGETQPTGRDLDVAIQGEGFFEVQMPDGTHAYTRSGEFSTRADHTLINSAGEPVLGDGGSPISLSAEGGKVTINADGNVVQGTASVGRLSIQKFANNSDLRPVAGGQFLPNQGVEPEPVSKPQLLQGFLESSNVSPLTEMVNLVQISRAYDANQHVITTSDKQMQKELDELG